MHKVNVTVGVDMGATHTRFCFLDENKNVISLSKSKTTDVINNGILNGLKKVINHYVEELNLTIDYMIVGLPATISKDRTRVLSTPNLNVPIEQFSNLIMELKDEFSCPVELERDVNLQLAYDTHHFGVQNKIVLGCYLGTGFGFSIWLNNDIYSGAHGVAGELGHIPYGDPLENCNCGNAGCLESIVSGNRLKQYYDSQNPTYPIENFFSQSENMDFIKNFIREAGKAIATVINLFDPDVIILGGGVIDMEEFPYDDLVDKALLNTRKPYPSESISFVQAASSAFNGSTGAALQGLSRMRR